MLALLLFSEASETVYSLQAEGAWEEQVEAMALAVEAFTILVGQKVFPRVWFQELPDVEVDLVAAVGFVMVDLPAVGSSMATLAMEEIVRVFFVIHLGESKK